MGRPTDEDRERQPPASEPAGRVEFDSRGNSVWRWATDLLESTSVLLKRLDNRELKLEPTQKVPVMRGANAARPKGTTPRGKSRAADAYEEAPRHPAANRQGGRDGGGGFDPYNSR
jgi:hypothetical protein